MKKPPRLIDSFVSVAGYLVKVWEVTNANGQTYCLKSIHLKK